MRHVPAPQGHPTPVAAELNALIRAAGSCFALAAEYGGDTVTVTETHQRAAQSARPR